MVNPAQPSQLQTKVELLTPHARKLLVDCRGLAKELAASGIPPGEVLRKQKRNVLAALIAQRHAECANADEAPDSGARTREQRVRSTVNKMKKMVGLEGGKADPTETALGAIGALQELDPLNLVQGALRRTEQYERRRAAHRKRMLPALRDVYKARLCACLLYTSPSPRDRTRSRMPSSA